MSASLPSLGGQRASRWACSRSSPLTLELAQEHLVRQGWGREEIGESVEDELHRLALRLRIFATELKLWRSCRGRGAQRRPQEDVDELAEQLEDDELARREDLHLVCDRLEVVRLVLVEA